MERATHAYGGGGSCGAGGAVSCWCRVAVLEPWRLELSGREGVEMEINQPEIGENERERVNPKRLE
jgi:hypothetical protein